MITWKLVLRCIPYLITAIALGWATRQLYDVGFRHGYETRWAEDFKRELKADMAQAKLADNQTWRTYLDDLANLVSSVQRFNAYLRYAAGAEQLTAGLADRVRSAEDRLQGCAVPGAAPGGSAEGADTRRAARLEELHRRQQRVYDLAGQCGAALETLALKPLCECSNP